MVIIMTLVVSAFVMILNETILSVALPHLTGDLGVSATTVQWLTSGFLLTMGVVIPTTGYILQRFTPRQVFLAAMTLFSLGTLICALSPGFPLLLAGRIVQATGTAVMIPLLMTSVMKLIPADRRGATMGTISIVIAVAPAIGPTIGGLILTSLDWRWMFWSVLPLSVAALVVGFVIFRLSSETRSTPLDLLSVALSAIGFGGIVYGFSTLGHGGDAALPPWAALVIGVVSLAVFIARQMKLQRTESALLDLRPFGHKPFVVAIILSALLFMTLLGAGAILLPIYLQNVLGASAAVTGLAVLPGGLLLGFMGRPVGRLFDRVGARPLVIPGAIGLAVSMWLFAALGASAVAVDGHRGPPGAHGVARPDDDAAAHRGALGAAREPVLARQRDPHDAPAGRGRGRHRRLRHHRGHRVDVGHRHAGRQRAAARVHGRRGHRPHRGRRLVHGAAASRRATEARTTAAVGTDRRVRPTPVAGH